MPNSTHPVFEGFTDLIGRIKGTKSKKRPSSDRGSVDLISSKQLGNETATNLINNVKTTTEKQQQKIADTEYNQAASTQLTISETKINPINNRISSNISPNKESSNKCDYKDNKEPLERNGDTVPLKNKKTVHIITQDNKSFTSTKDCLLKKEYRSNRYKIHN